MASGGREPPDKLKDKYFKCHPKQKFSAVVCLICENVYHVSDFKLLNNTKILSDTLVICPEHVDEINITCNIKNVALNESARLILTQIKNNQKQELRKQILKEIEEGRTEVDHNETIFEDKSEIESMKIENTLLKQLVTELQEKNDLLKKLLDKEKINKSDDKKTYAEVFMNVKPVQKRIPKIIVKKTNLKEKVTTKEGVLYYLNKEKNIQTNKVEFKNENEVSISCMNEESLKTVEKLLTAKLASSFKIEKEQIMKPKIKIVGIDNFSKANIEEMEQDINSRNFKKCETKCKVLHMYTNKKTNLQSIIVEVSAELYKNIKENRDKVFVGHQRCKVYDLINVRPCYNCGRFGHSGSKCHNQVKCLKCTENHNTNTCNKETLKCLNCSYRNSTYGLNLNTEHATYDSDTCTILKTKIKKYIEMTDYPMKPVIPSFVGYSGNFQERKNATSTAVATSALGRSVSTNSANSAFPRKQVTGTVNSPLLMIPQSQVTEDSNNEE